MLPPSYFHKKLFSAGLLLQGKFFLNAPQRAEDVTGNEIEFFPAEIFRFQMIFN